MNVNEFVKRLPLTDELSNLPEEFSYLMTQFSPAYELKRKNAAQIVYAFLKYVLKLSDIDDKEKLSRTGQIKDLYDCRVCAHSIQQVVTRGIMEPKYILQNAPGNNPTVIFGTEDNLSENEAEEIILQVSLFL